MNVYSIRARDQELSWWSRGERNAHARTGQTHIIHTLPARDMSMSLNKPGRVPRTPRQFLAGLLGTARKSFIKGETLTLN